MYVQTKFNISLILYHCTCIIHCFCIHTDLNTLDWGRNNLVAIGLGPDVFLWNAGNGSVRKLLELTREGDYVCSVSWAGNGKYLAVGSDSAAIQLWDVEKEKRVRTMGGHTDRVGVLTWSKHTLTRYDIVNNIHYVS